jgi:DNA-binding winged helix-turn-helix (wHTH) protein/Tol biopolymer transport system component
LAPALLKQCVCEGGGFVDGQLGDGANSGKTEVYRFGAFELRTETGELFQHGIRIRLQTKPFQILEALLAKPGKLVTREELCNQLWPAGTFVDFESGLNTATNRLRAALKDSADSPRYIETLPRLGYRFICPVEKLAFEEPAQNGHGPAARVPDTVLAARRALCAPKEPKLVAREITEPVAVTREILVSTGAPMAGPPQNTGTAWVRKLYRATPAVPPAMVIMLVFGYVQLNASRPHQSPSFRQLNFRAGLVESARFAAGTNNAVYTMMEADGGKRTLLVSLDGSSSQTLSGIENASRLGSSKLLRASGHSQSMSTLTDDLRCADWFPDGRQVALVSTHDTESQIEFPANHVVYRSSAFISNLRVSPIGDEVAFLEHPVRDDDEGYPVIVDRQGNSRILTKLWSSADGLAWSPSGREVWFTAAGTGVSRALYAVSKRGNVRLVYGAPSSMRLFDISRTGRILIGLDDLQTSMVARLANDSAEEDVTKFDESHVDDISADGQLILFTEAGNAGGQHYSAYTFDQQSRKAVRFAAGRGFALSPDKNSAITIDPQDRSFFSLTNFATRWSRKIQGEGFEYQWIKFHPDGRRVLAGGAYPGQPFQICMQSLEGGKPMPIKNATYMDSVQVSPDGERIAGRIGGQTLIVDLDTGVRHTVRLGGKGMPIAWSRDGLGVYCLLFDQSPSRVVRADWRTGSVQDWKTLATSGTSEFAGLASAVAAPSANAYAYSTTYHLSKLYVVDGWF